MEGQRSPSMREDFEAHFIKPGVHDYIRRIVTAPSARL